MKHEDFENKMQEAAKKFATMKKAPKRPDTQFIKGAMWAWELLTGVHSEQDYEARLRHQIESRTGWEPWMVDVVRSTAQVLVDIDETRKEINDTGRTWLETGYNGQMKRVACPHIAHEKDLMRTLTMLYEHLGLSFKANPEKMVLSAKKGVDDTDPMAAFYADAKK